MHDTTDRALFYSTYIRIENGKNTPFWKARWLSGAASKDMALNLDKASRHKRRMVHTKLQNDNGIRNISSISTPSMLEEYVVLYMALSSITLSDH
jgi:hypothetical protein